MVLDPRISEETGLRSTTTGLSLLGLIVLQAAFVDAFLPIGEWFTSWGAMYSDDYGMYYGFTLRSIKYLEEFGSIWAYDPGMRAGNIATGNLTTISNNGWALFSYIVHSWLGLSTELAFKLFFVLGTLCAPLACYAAARCFGLARGGSLAAAALGALLMHATVMVNFYQWGSVSFIFACYLAPLCVALFYRFCLSAELKYLLAAACCLLCTLWIHLFSVPILAVPLLVCYGLCFRKIRTLHHCAIWAAVVLVFLAYLPGVYPFLQLQDTLVKSAGAVFYANKSLWGPVHTYLLRNNLFNSYENIIFRKDEWIEIIVLLLAVYGLLNSYLRGGKILSLTLGSASGFLFWLSYYGNFFSITSITPMRFQMSLNILLIYPAAAGLTGLYELFLADKPRKTRLIAAGLSCYLLLTLIAPAYYHIFYRKAFRTVYRVPEPCKNLTDWIKNNTSPRGRIMLESSDFETGHQLYGGHFEILFPLWTDREYLDGLSLYSPVADTFVSFSSGTLFKRPIGSFTLQELKAYFNLYNINWIVYWSEESRKALSAFSSYIVPVATFDKLSVCQVNRAPTYFLKGSGVSRSETNKIYLTDLQADGGEVIISYHWMKYLKTDSPLTMERAFLGDDPVGFIKLKKPPPSVLIYNNYN